MRHYVPRVLAMDIYDVTRLPQELAVVFVTSTTGQVQSDILLYAGFSCQGPPS